MGLWFVDFCSGLGYFSLVFGGCLNYWWFCLLLLVVFGIVDLVLFEVGVCGWLGGLLGFCGFGALVLVMDGFGDLLVGC